MDGFESIHQRREKQQQAQQQRKMEELRFRAEHPSLPPEPPQPPQGNGRGLWEAVRLFLIITMAILAAQEIRGWLVAQQLRTAASPALGTIDEILAEGTAWAELSWQEGMATRQQEAREENARATARPRPQQGAVFSLAPRWQSN